MPLIDADEVARRIDMRSDQWTPEKLHDAFTGYGCAIVRSAISVQQLNEMHNLVTQAYRSTTDFHVYDRDLVKLTEGRISGFELVDVPLLQDLLKLIYAGQGWRQESVTARRIRGFDTNHDWQLPLKLHLDSQFHGFHFTVNFWIPFHECGVAAPSLQLLPLNYLETRRYSGFTGDLQRDGERCYFGHFAKDALDQTVLRREFGDNCFFRPPMNPGDVIVSSNWIIHGSYRTPQMKSGRTSVEIRFIGEKCDIGQ
jgi:hypothetical protein